MAALGPGVTGPSLSVTDAQRDVRATFVGGFFGQLVSGVLWLASAALGTWGSTRSAILTLVLGGFFIFPLTTLALRLSGRPAGLPKGHPFGELGWQVAFTLPLTLPLVGAAALYRLEWFYPAFMMALGAHYLPFAFLYGMRLFLPLAALLVGGGFGLGRYGVGGFTTGAWATGALLLVFAVLGRMAVAREGLLRAPPPAPSTAAAGPR